jgi:hypothetical protein
MKNSTLTLKDVKQAISQFSPEEQAQLLRDLPKLLAISRSELAMLDLAESAFDFWNNPQDAAYDAI